MTSRRVCFALTVVLLAACGNERPAPSKGSSTVASPSAPVPEDEPGPAVEDLDPDAFHDLLQRKGGIVLDVRTPGEVARRRLPDASVIDVFDPEFERKAGAMQKDKAIFVYCASGARSARAGATLVKLGFDEVYNLRGGITAWVRAGLPVDEAALAVADGATGMSVDEFDAVVAAGKPVLADFHTEWCTPCRKMAPIVDDLSVEWKGRVEVLRVDIDRSEALAARENIQGVPVFVLYDSGKETWRHSGEIAREQLAERLAAVGGR